MFDCITCGKVYTHNRGLNRHSKIHDGSTTSCGLCAKVFTQQSNLSRHAKNVHKAARLHTNDHRNAVRIGSAMDRPTVKD
ncbi:unnamed protein product [Macrosiphum euphorbiae]|uniref:C2H2-type domain-containing protein n=1 Tax=Macrosiphum euphorbiae TaxID=13131 RepID=A0AAV0XNB9_9HEMI|nr:unnamed protein product [Macrosiphum euphorbiae]